MIDFGRAILSFWAPSAVLSWEEMSFLRLLCGTVAFGTLASAAMAQSTFTDRIGVKHVVTVSIAGMNQTPVGSTKDQPTISDLQVTIRLSDHAKEAQFFGELSISWPEFAANGGGAEQEIWRDQRDAINGVVFPKRQPQPSMEPSKPGNRDFMFQHGRVILNSSYRVTRSDRQSPNLVDGMTWDDTTHSAPRPRS